MAITIVEKLQKDVRDLSLPQGRKVGTGGHEVARNFLSSRMAELGLQFYTGNAFDLPYQYHGRKFHNLTGVVPGRERRTPPVLIGAHYDSVISAPCADDNAAAVAIALSVAEELIRNPPDRDVVIAFFDAEEPPYYLGPGMGSVRFFEDQKDARSFHAALIMDLVGHDVPLPIPALEKALPRFGNLLFIMGAESHPILPAVLERCRGDRELPVIAVQNRLVGDMSDHHIFRLNGVPYLFLSCGRWAHYHQPSDTPDRLNYAKMERIRNLLLCLTKELASVELPAAKECDTTSLEIKLLREALGPGLPILLAAVGLSQLETRRDIDLLAARLQAYFKL
jgi:hypothetical protein